MESMSPPPRAGQYLTFFLSERSYGVPVSSVREINRMTQITPVPRTPVFISGVMNLRGKIIPVIDLRKRFGLPANEHSEQSRIVVVEVHGRVIGFIVDRVSEVLRINSKIVEPAPPMACSVDSDFIAGVGKLEDRLLILLDLQKLFNKNEVGAMAV